MTNYQLKLFNLHLQDKPFYKILQRLEYIFLLNQIINVFNIFYI